MTDGRPSHRTDLRPRPRLHLHLHRHRAPHRQSHQSPSLYPSQLQSEPRPTRNARRPTPVLKIQLDPCLAVLVREWLLRLLAYQAWLDQCPLLPANRRRLHICQARRNRAYGRGRTSVALGHSCQSHPPTTVAMGSCSCSSGSLRRRQHPPTPRVKSAHRRCGLPEESLPHRRADLSIVTRCWRLTQAQPAARLTWLVVQNHVAKPASAHAMLPGDRR